MIDLTVLIVVLVVIVAGIGVAYYFWRRSHPGKYLPMQKNPHYVDPSSAAVYNSPNDPTANRPYGYAVPGSDNPNSATNPLNPLNPGLPYNPASPNPNVSNEQAEDRYY
jgi:hypothetical protein